MAFSRTNAFLFTALLISPVLGQSGVLTNGKSTLPSCAQSCGLLQQAATACGGQTDVDATIWNCFCQSNYLVNLRTTDTDVCSTECTNPADSQQVSTWYNANCGTDDGASEHPGVTAVASGVPAATTTPGTSTTTAASTSASAVNNGSSSSGGGGNSWVDTHWPYIVMVVVLAVGLTAFAFILIWVRNRYRRKRDMNGGWNTGITARRPESGIITNVPSTNHVNASFASADHIHSPVGSTAVRNRDSTMPYGYGYTRSESRLGYQADRGSAVPSEDLEKQAPSRVQSPDSVGGRSRSGRRVLVRDRLSRAPSGYSEKIPQEDTENP